MKLLRYIIIGVSALLAICAGASVGHCTTVTGTIKVNGTPFTGNMVYQLSYPGSTGSYINMPVSSAPIPINNGVFDTLDIDGNDIQLPRGTYYAFKFYDPFGRMVTRLNYVITGSSYDLGAAVPTPVLTNNVNFLDLLGLRNVSILNLTINNSFQIQNGTIINRTGIQNAENIMGIYFAQAFNIQNPSSTTCGLAEAQTAMPSTGGILIAQPGTCNMTGTFTITKPITLMGMGPGGYADSSTFSTYLSPTTLNETGTGPLVQVLPATSTTLSGVSLINIELTGGSGSTDLLQLGNPTYTNAYLRSVTLDGVLIHSGSAHGVNVVGNLAGLHIRNSTFSRNAGSGIAFTPLTGYSVTGVEIGPKVYSSRNGVDGLAMSGVGTYGVKATDFTADHNTGYGAYVYAPAVSATFTAYQSTFTSNTAGNVLLAAGSGHVIESSTIASSAAHGVDITMSGTSNIQNVSLKDNIFTPTNTTYDIDNASTAYALLYPQVTQNAATNGTFHYIRPADLSRVCNTYGCYILFPDGTIEAEGHSTGATGGDDNEIVTITFPVTFTSTAHMEVVVSATGAYPSGDGNPHAMDCHTILSSISTTGISAILSAPIGVGGTGAYITAGDYCSYHVFGY